MRVNDASIRIQAVQVPARDSFTAIYEGSILKLRMSDFQVTTFCKGSADEPAPARSGSPRYAPSKVGYMQIATLETNWAYYRGRTPADGSMIEDYSKPKGTALCRDFDSNYPSPWYVGTPNIEDAFGVPVGGSKGPWEFEVIFGDRPGNEFQATRVNPKTKAPNHLFEVKVAVAFVTTLVEESAPGTFRHLRHFHWSACWHFRQASEEAAEHRRKLIALDATRFWRSEFKAGPPADARYVELLNDTRRARAWEQVVQDRGRNPDPLSAFDYKSFDLLKADGQLL